MSVLRRTLPGAAAALALLAAGARPAGAQTSRAWSLCFATHVASCSDFLLTTTATLDAARTRTGTLVDLLVRHRQGGGVVSGLQDVSFYFAPAGTGADATPLTPEARFGAPPVPPGAELRWSGAATSALAAPADPSLNVLSLSNPTLDQFIGGCLGGAFDALYQSPLTTCGAQAYRFAFATAAQLDADAVRAIAATVYAGDGDGDAFPDQAACNAPTDGGPSVGFDLGDSAAGDVCRVTPLAATVPEPATALLVASGLLLLPTARAARSRLRRTAP